MKRGFAVYRSTVFKRGRCLGIKQRASLGGARKLRLTQRCENTKGFSCADVFSGFFQNLQKKHPAARIKECGQW